MKRAFLIVSMVSVGLLSAGIAKSANVMSVSYGSITGVNQQQRDTTEGKTGGALVGGLLGLYTGKGKSGSNKALRTLGGAAVGSAAGGAMASGTELVYTVSLVDGGTVQVIMDSGNFHRGDCVSVEQGGASANMRRVSSEFCTHNAQVPAVYKSEHQKEAGECAEAKQQLLNAETEDAVKTAQMKMNILCQD